VTGVRLKAVTVRTREHVEALRVLRNATSYGFSSFTGVIEPAQQQRWWRAMQGTMRAWLYRDSQTGAYVGFGLVRREVDGTWWNSIGVHPDYQGQGYGSYITHDVLKRHGRELHSLVKSNNLQALGMHNMDEWQLVPGSPPGLVHFQSKV
jgi:GNAT superfamily N-acetyltransferase